MVSNATAAAAKVGWCADTSAAKTEWRKFYLKTACRIESLKDISTRGSQFAEVMAALQMVARDGINWIMRVDAGRPNELLWHAREVLKTFGIVEAFACGIARNAFKLVKLPTLEELTAEQLDKLLRILRAQGGRIATAQKRRQPF